jgi:hypothetical protein
MSTPPSLHNHILRIQIYIHLLSSLNQIMKNMFTHLWSNQVPQWWHGHLLSRHFDPCGSIRFFALNELDHIDSIYQSHAGPKDPAKATGSCGEQNWTCGQSWYKANPWKRWVFPQTVLRLLAIGLLGYMCMHACMNVHVHVKTFICSSWKTHCACVHANIYLHFAVVLISFTLVGW